MRTRILPFLLLAAMASCQKQQASQDEETAAIGKRACASQEVLEQQIMADPTRGQRLEEIESFIQQRIAAGALGKNAGTADITIPVVVHVLYNKPAENISDAQVASQIDVLNEDFNLRNKDRNQVPSLFSGLRADVGLRFTLAQTIHKETKIKSFNATDNMKFSNKGGDDAIDPSRYLNIWVCNLGQNLLGYAQFPGGPFATDGVVILYSAFGRTGTLIAKYDKGRTATHEIGHWLNLRHIWGDKTCGSDLVDDTPKHTTANFDCPAFPHYNSCGDNAVEMTMNYMDYTADACMYMFSNGQKDRMLALFLAGGARTGFVQ